MRCKHGPLEIWEIRPKVLSINEGETFESRKQCPKERGFMMPTNAALNLLVFYDGFIWLQLG
jgi:hypothetical protein